MKKGIFLVANLKSQDQCSNLIYTIRESGCTLPIRLIHFGGQEIQSPYVLQHVELLHFKDFPLEAQNLVNNIQTVLTKCPLGFLYRFLAWFSDWDEFIYSDNDVVALCNWEKLFPYLSEFDLVHADEEYTTKGIYNYYQPEFIKKTFGPSALESAITAGHIVVKKNNNMIADFNTAAEWFRKNPKVAIPHDQALLHVASLIGNWKVLNLCKTEQWMSSWAGDYKNTLSIVQAGQAGKKISHLHYSGGNPSGNLAIEDFLYSNLNTKSRIKTLVEAGLKDLSGVNKIKTLYKKGLRKIREQLKKT